MKRLKNRLHKVVIIGANPAGIAATNKLGELGVPVTLVDREANLDRKLANDAWRLDSGVPLNHAHRPGLIRILRNPAIQCLLPADVASIRHTPQGFRVGLIRRQTFTNPDACILCGRCAEICPVSTENGHKAVVFDGRLSLPGRPIIDKRRTPLCQERCPLGVNAQGYVALARVGKYAEALALIRDRNILPGICGRICNHPCEDDCRRGTLDDPVAIRDIKRFLADYGAAHPEKAPTVRPAERRSEHFAVIGAGPAGIAAAAEFARAGCAVTVFDREAAAGGLLRYGIGPHRLPRHILDAELTVVRDMGVAFATGHAVDLSDIQSMAASYSGVVVAVGSWKDRRLGIPGEDLGGISGCLEFLSRCHREEMAPLRQRAVVIGDGNAAFDLARTLIRMDASVTLLSWFGKDDIPADPEEIHGAIQEGVVIQDRCQVVAFLGREGRLDRLRLKPTRPGKPDADGVAWPVIVPGASAFEIAADRVFVAIGQIGVFEPGSSLGGLEITDRGLIRTDDNARTALAGVYAAGDAVSGPSTVVKAMASGRLAAIAALSDICGIPMPAPICVRPADRDFRNILSDIPVHCRIPMPEAQPAARSGGFTEVTLGLSEVQVRDEANRCLQCGVCAECLECVRVCGAMGAICHTDTEESLAEHAGAVIIADPDMAPAVKGDDIIRAYGPKSAKPDVYAMLMRGYAAAAQALLLLGDASWVRKGNGFSFTQPDPGLSPDIRIGVFVCRCDDSLGWMDGMDRYVASLAGIPDVVHAGTLASACVPEGIAAIIKTVRDKGITRIVLGSCVCCPLNFVCSACTDQRSRLKHALFTATGISRSMVMVRNIRGEALSLLQKDPDEALKRLRGLIDRSVRRSRKLTPFPSPNRLYNFATAVIGRSEAALTSAATLADIGMDVFTFGSDAASASDLPEHPNIHAFTGARVTRLSGNLGDFQLTVETDDGHVQQMQVGAVILGEKSRRRIRHIHQEGLPSRTTAVTMQSVGVTGVPFFYPGMTAVSGLFLADPPGIHISARQKGAAAAMLTAAAMPNGPRQNKGFTVTVDEAACRGCGRCVDACAYQAVTLKQNDIGWHAAVDEAFCKGCGNCISVCPTNAADSPFRGQKFFEQTLEEILMPQTPIPTMVP